MAICVCCAGGGKASTTSIVHLTDGCAQGWRFMNYERGYGIHRAVSAPFHTVRPVFRYERIDGEDSDDPGGCILAHIMGLGKTLTTIAFLHTYMGMPAADLGARRVLVVVPANVLFNFYSEVGLAMTND